jgi:hypothetical protein
MIQPDKVHIEHFNAKGNILKAKLTFNPFKIGERIQIENEKGKVQGVVISKLGKYITMRIEQVSEKQLPTVH